MFYDMALASGTRIGPYEVTAPLGAGGMGEVYRARDTALGRDVAVKVLPDAFANDPDRLARFEREARTLATLSRSDIWAFGVVLYEMLTGRRPFSGDDITETIAAIVREQPDLTAVPRTARKLVAACLEKDPKKRLQAIGDMRLLVGNDETSQPVATAPLAWHARVAWAATAVAALSTAGLALVHFRETPPAAPTIRSIILPPAATTFDFTGGLGLPALSPDGRRIVFGARTADGKTPLWVRSLEALTAQPLAGTEGATFPFWSPDSRFIAFFADGKLKKIDASGGPALTLADAVSGRGGSPHKKKTGKKPHEPLVTRWGNLKVKEIKRRDVRDLLDEIVARGAPIMANRTLALVRKMFNFAIERDWLDTNPCHMVKRPAPDRQRQRVLSEDEVRAVWKALDEEHPIIAALFRIRLLTAQRGSEVHGASWDEMDLTTGWWTIPGERSKNGLDHRVPLSPQALRILKDLRPITEKSNSKSESKSKSKWVFPSTRKTGPHINHAQKAIERIVKRSGVEFRGHDLRRTAASLMVGAGVPRLVVQKILNHVETGVTAIYDRHSYDPEKRSALDFWGRRLEAMLANKRDAKVLTFEARR